jgi:hypothetical protein
MGGMRRKRMKKASLLSALVLLMTLASVASAGEVKGPPGEDGAEGGVTPIDGFWSGDGAASICSFSGLNDVIDEDEPTRTQSYGTFLVLFGDLLEASPGDECNPARGPIGNPK